MSKRVWALYRVSTDRQGDENDIPQQKKACHAFAEQKGWEITNEIVEKLSGFSTPLEEREALFDIKEAAHRGEFDILLFFMSDRLGRDMQYTFYVQGLYQLGIKVFSVVEGELKSDEHQDALINFIRFWQSEGESRKTSVRVKNAFDQLNEEGWYLGGNIGFGYKLLDTGEKRNSKSNKTIKKIAIDEDESKIVKMIFNLVLEKGYGSGRIAKHLNELGLNNRGNIWRHNTITRMLRNPLYMGRKRYNATERVGGIKSKKRKEISREEWKLQPFNPDLVIIFETDFKKAQDIMDKRYTPNIGNSTPPDGHVPLKSQVLLSGLIACGYCGRKLKTDYTLKKWTKKNGQVSTYKVYRYKCHHARSMPEGHLQRQWGSTKLDEKVETKTIEAVKKLLKLISFVDEKDSFSTSEIDTRKVQLKELQSQFNEKDKAYKNSESMFDKLMSVSPDKAMLLLDKMNEYASSKMEIATKINRLQEEIKESEMSSNDIDNFIHQMENWIEKFTQSKDLDVKKTLLSQVLEKAVIYKDDVVIDLNITLERAMYRTEAIQQIEDVRARGQYVLPNGELYHDKEQFLGEGFMSCSEWNGVENTPLKDDYNVSLYKDLLQALTTTKSIQFEYTIQR